MLDWELGIETLQRRVADALEPLGNIELDTPCSTLRKVTVTHRTGASVRVMIGVELPLRLETYFVSVLRVMDAQNPRIIHAQNETSRRLPAVDGDLGPILAVARQSYIVAVESYPGAGRDA